MELIDDVKHFGCALCGSTKQKTLTSQPLFSRMHSVALCNGCAALSPSEIAKRYAENEAVKKEALRKMREQRA